MSETLDSMIKTAKDAHKLNKEIAREAHAFNKELAKETHKLNKELAREAHAFNKELVKASVEDADALIRELSDAAMSAE